MKRIIAAIVAVVFTIILVVGGIVYLINSQDASARHTEQKQFKQANTICGSPPVNVKTHGAGWSYGSYIEVTCQDGTKRVIR